MNEWEVGGDLGFQYDADVTDQLHPHVVRRAINGPAIGEKADCAPQQQVDAAMQIVDKRNALL
jgi:hypothetical protein